MNSPNAPKIDDSYKHKNPTNSRHEEDKENLAECNSEKEDGQESESDVISKAKEHRSAVDFYSESKYLSSRYKNIDVSSDDVQIKEKNQRSRSRSRSNSDKRNKYSKSKSDSENESSSKALERCDKREINPDSLRGEYDRHGNRKTLISLHSENRNEDYKPKKGFKRSRSNSLEPDSKPIKKSEFYKPVEIPSTTRIPRINKKPGGVYIPPARMREMEEQKVISEPLSAKKKHELEKNRQKEYWEKLKKGVRGLVNKVNVTNIKEISHQIFDQNLIRGRGLFCRYIIRAQSQSQTFTPVYSALVSVINSRLPILGELLINRLVIQFRKAYQRDDKAKCLSTTQFLAHLTNQRIVHEILAFQILQLLLENPTDDSVEIAVGFMKEVGSFLSALSPKVLNAVIETFRSILHEADIDKRSQYMIEVLLQVRREGFKDNLSIPDGLDLVDEDDQIVHEVSIEDESIEVHDELDIFRFDDNFQENEDKYNSIKMEIIGDSDTSESGSEAGSDEDDLSESEEAPTDSKAGTTTIIKDLTETELLNLRKTIYLTIMSSLGFEEASHKLLRIQIPENDLKELSGMLIECCSQERAYKSFYGLVGERLCKVKDRLRDAFCYSFVDCYVHIHRYETNHIRHIARFFGHLLSSGAIPFTVFSCVTLSEEETTASSRIFLKILMQDLSESMGLDSLNSALHNPESEFATSKMFPTDSAKDIRFAINYYTSIGLGALTENLRSVLSNLTQNSSGIPDSSSDSESGSASDSDSDSNSSSDSASSSGSLSDSDSDSGSDSSSISSSISSRSRSRSMNKRTSDSKLRESNNSTHKSISRNRSNSPKETFKDRERGLGNDFRNGRMSYNSNNRKHSEKQRMQSPGESDLNDRPNNIYNRRRDNRMEPQNRSPNNRGLSSTNRSRSNNQYHSNSALERGYFKRESNSRKDEDFMKRLRDRDVPYSTSNRSISPIRRQGQEPREEKYTNNSRSIDSGNSSYRYRRRIDSSDNKNKNHYKNRETSRKVDRDGDMHYHRGLDETKDDDRRSNRTSKLGKKRRSNSYSSKRSDMSNDGEPGLKRNVSRGSQKSTSTHSIDSKDGRITKPITSKPISLLDPVSISLICRPTRSKSRAVNQVESNSTIDTKSSKVIPINRQTKLAKVRTPSHSSNERSESETGSVGNDRKSRNRSKTTRSSKRYSRDRTDFREDDRSHRERRYRNSGEQYEYRRSSRVRKDYNKRKHSRDDRSQRRSSRAEYRR
ncbi:Pre-mRNA-splicing factor CWC22 [Smittium mucronatum]|uniref:Pre-mRNA-splicing factor CWC22 n=1 Tax=Smittium mucronatum TaxID=133383 RepID=A0A1R0GLB7_9FUNG|nr:Pre-mRNA-splicing factor CWC22 [Smittium mucronatum]